LFAITFGGCLAPTDAPDVQDVNAAPPPVESEVALGSEPAIFEATPMKSTVLAETLDVLCSDGTCSMQRGPEDLIDAEPIFAKGGKGGGKGGGGGPSAKFCGDGKCRQGETCETCEADCGVCPAPEPPPEPTCGDGTCDADEDCGTCEADCGACPAPEPPPEPTCGDGTCDSDEDCTTCEADCGACPAPEPPPSEEPVCGDAVCDGLSGEMCTTCPECNTTDAVCGNGECEASESASTCRPDCGDEPWPNSWAQWEDEVVAIINQHRAAGTDCPSGAKNPVGPVTMDPALQLAARLHSWDQSHSGYFSHTSCNGRSPWARAADAGTSAYSEVIGWGYSSPDAIVNGWLSSTAGHCDALMNGSRTAIGVGYASEGGRLWTGMFR
jgi:uncharacterized protein YkwD